MATPAMTNLPEAEEAEIIIRGEDGYKLTRQGRVYKHYYAGHIYVIVIKVTDGDYVWTVVGHNDVGTSGTLEEALREAHKASMNYWYAP